MEDVNIRSIPIVGKFLIDPDVLERLEGVQEKYGLPVDRAVEYLTLTRAVLDRDITLEHMPELIAEAFGVDADKAKLIACDVAGTRLLPLEAYFPGTAKQIEAWGGKLSDYPNIQVGKEKVLADRFAGRLTEELELPLQPNHIKRLAFLVRGYYSGEKSREATLTFFSRPVNIGGLGLAAGKADELIKMVDEEKSFTEFVDDSEQETFTENQVNVAQEIVEEPVAQAAAAVEEKIEQKVAEPVVEPVVEPPVVVAETPTPNLPEIAPDLHLATTTPVTPEVSFSVPADPAIPPLASGDGTIVAKKLTSHSTEGEYEGVKNEISTHEKMLVKRDIRDVAADDRLLRAVDVAVESASPTLQLRRVAKNKFADIAKLAIRGVREPIQTRLLLERELGFSASEIDGLMQAIDSGSAIWRGAGVKLVAPITSTPTQVVSEQEVMDKRFAEVTKTLPKQSLDPIMPSARVSAARTKEDENAAQAAKVDPIKLEAAAEASRPEQAKAMLTVGSVPPPSEGEQRVVTDVQFRPHLVGPVEELGTMGPADFRRLSSDPLEAAKKVEDLLASLQTTSYEDRIRGVGAWRSSPMNRLYVSMAQESLAEGISLADIASRRRNKGEESLSPAEMKAMGTLNARIRF